MSFLAIKLLKLGYSQAKKHKANKEQQQQHPHYPAQFPEPYPLTEYPPGMGPGSNIHYQQPPHLPPYQHQYQYQYPPGQAPAPTSAPAPAAPTKETKAAKSILPMLITILRFIQFITGLIIISYYGADIHHDTTTTTNQNQTQTLNPKWAFAIITAFLATSTAGLYLVIPFCLRRVKSTFSVNIGLLLTRFLWELFLVLLWLVLFGIFGKMYLGVNPAHVQGQNQGQGQSLNGAGGKRDLNSTSSSRGGPVNGTAAATAPMTANNGLGDASKIQRMQHAVWLDLANLVLWAVTATWLLVRWLKGRRAVKSVGDGEKGPGL